MQRATQVGQGQHNGGNQFPLASMGAGAQPPQAQQQASPTSPNPQQLLAMYAQKVGEMEKLAGEIMELQAVTDPEGQALLVPIAQAGQALKARVKEIGQRQQAGPGAPGGAQESGGGSPAPNPDEGGAPAAMAA